MSSSMVIYLPCRLAITQSTFADIPKGLPDRPVPGQNPPHPDCHPGEVHIVAVQPSLQDPPPVTHVPVCRHAARRPQLAVPEHHRSAGSRHRGHAGTVNAFPLTFFLLLPGKHLCSLWRSGSPQTYLKHIVHLQLPRTPGDKGMLPYWTGLI